MIDVLELRKLASDIVPGFCFFQEWHCDKNVSPKSVIVQAAKGAPSQLVEQTFLQDIGKPHWLKVIEISLRTQHPHWKSHVLLRDKRFGAKSAVNLACIKTVKIEFWFCPRVTSKRSFPWNE